MQKVAISALMAILTTTTMAPADQQMPVGARTNDGVWCQHRRAYYGTLTDIEIISSNKLSVGAEGVLLAHQWTPNQRGRRNYEVFYWDGGEVLITQGDNILGAGTDHGRNFPGNYIYFLDMNKTTLRGTAKDHYDRMKASVADVCGPHPPEYYTQMDTREHQDFGRIIKLFARKDMDMLMVDPVGIRILEKYLQVPSAYGEGLLRLEAFGQKRLELRGSGGYADKFETALNLHELAEFLRNTRLEYHWYDSEYTPAKALAALRNPTRKAAFQKEVETYLSSERYQKIKAQIQGELDDLP